MEKVVCAVFLTKGSPLKIHNKLRSYGYSHRPLVCLHKVGARNSRHFSGNKLSGKNDQYVYCCSDTTVRSVGSNSKEGQMSPHRLLTTTIGDQLKLATNFRSKVIGVSLKDRAAILPAGHSADAAYWWDTSAGHFVTSTYYMDKLPAWVEKFQ